MHISYTSTESITVKIITDRQTDRHRDRESQSTKRQKWFTSWRRSRKLLGAFLIEATRSRAFACLVLRLDPFACFFGWGPVHHKHQSKVQNMWIWEPTNDQLWQILMQSCWKAKLNHLWCILCLLWYPEEFEKELTLLILIWRGFIVIIKINRFMSTCIVLLQCLQPC